MTTDEIHRCSICGKPTYFSYRFFTTKPRLETDQGLYEIGCSECGEYRVAPNAEETMAKQSPLHRASLVRLIHTANARGNRYCLNDGREVSLDSIARSGTMATAPGTPARTTDSFSGFSTRPSVTGLTSANVPTEPTEAPSRTPGQR
jgi:hypothetical protein